MQKFFIGLDIGTESVGIVATDENYNILRSHGKDMWAVRQIPSKGAHASIPGNAVPVEQAAATRNASVVFPSPGSPWITVIFPKGIYGFQSHATS